MLNNPFNVCSQANNNWKQSSDKSESALIYSNAMLSVQQYILFVLIEAAISFFFFVNFLQYLFFFISFHSFVGFASHTMKVLSKVKCGIFQIEPFLTFFSVLISYYLWGATR